MRVAAGISFFDKIKELPLCLGDPADPTALCNNVDFLIGIDGRYTGYDSDHNYSNDGSYEFIKQYENAILEKYYGYQTAKRQRYLDIAGELKCDYLIVVDTDEFLSPDYKNRDWIAFYKNLDHLRWKYVAYHVFRVNLFIEDDYSKAFNIARKGRHKAYARIHVNPGDQRYAYDCHYRWCNKRYSDKDLVLNNELEYFSCPNVVNGVSFTTTSKYRDEQTLKARDKWAWWTINEERRREYNRYCDFKYGFKHYPDSEYWEYEPKTGKPIRNPTVNLL